MFSKRNEPSFTILLKFNHVSKWPFIFISFRTLGNSIFILSRIISCSLNSAFVWLSDTLVKGVEHFAFFANGLAMYISSSCPMSIDKLLRDFSKNDYSPLMSICLLSPLHVSSSVLSSCIVTVQLQWLAIRYCPGCKISFGINPKFFIFHSSCSRFFVQNSSLHVQWFSTCASATWLMHSCRLSVTHWQ